MPEGVFLHGLAAAVLLARLADVGSTYLVTPHLHLEANDLMRRFRWPFAWLTLGLCVVPYVSPGAGVVILVASLLVAASNIRNAWFVRAFGETEYLSLLRSAAARSSRREALACMLGSALLVAAAGLVLLYFYPAPSWAWHFSLGILAYAFALGLHGSSFIGRVFE